MKCFVLLLAPKYLDLPTSSRNRDKSLSFSHSPGRSVESLETTSLTAEQRCSCPNLASLSQLFFRAFKLKKKLVQGAHQHQEIRLADFGFPSEVGPFRGHWPSRFCGLARLHVGKVLLDLFELLPSPKQRSVTRKKNGFLAKFHRKWRYTA